VGAGAGRLRLASGALRQLLAAADAGWAPAAAAAVQLGAAAAAAAARMLRHPPAVALIISGSPTSPSTRMASASSAIRPAEPGTVGTPAFFMVSLRAVVVVVVVCGWWCVVCAAGIAAAAPRTTTHHPRSPAARPAAHLAVDLSPMTLMCWGSGPMNSMPWSRQISTKPAFSDRKP
jgi:hypothetical protein